MADSDWRNLQKSFFPELPLNCGNAATPGIVEGADLRDWSRKASTPDQLRIERYLDRFDLKTKRILHIGIGNSGLARRLHSRAAEIIGTTIDEPEMKVARSLSLSNYTAIDHNKYAGGAAAIPGRFDFIVDNNPTSPCCCLGHLASFFSLIDAKLTEDGQFVTDADGLAWVPPDANPRWRFDFQDLAKVAATFGLEAHRIDRSIYVVARGRPAKPASTLLLSYYMRRMGQLPEKVAAIAKRGNSRLRGLGIRAVTRSDRHQ